MAQPLLPLTTATDFWWHAAWGPVILNPLSWYVVVLWYSGYWDDPRSALRRRQGRGLLVTIVLGLVLSALAVYSNPLPGVSTLTGYSSFALEKIPSLGGIPLLVLGLPVYIVLCISQALDALLRPGPTARFMGQQARRRARPWLVATSLTLLAVSLIVGFVLVWLYQTLLARPSYETLAGPVQNTLAWFDLLVAALIGLAILLIGQSIVSYEIFTGKPLPRRGLLRQWQNTIILAAYVSAVVSGTVIFSLRPVYALLLTTLLLTVFYALFSWRITTERDQIIDRLRPFVGGQPLYDRLLDAGTGADQVVGEQSLQALCRDVLEIDRACLAPLGSLAPLAGAPVVHPPGARFALPDLTGLAAHFSTPQVVALPLAEGDFAWAVPLWSERGLVGLLLLGAKREGGHYTQEEMEIARAAGERLVDQRAIAGLARRLVGLQRRSLVETQLLDRQARRVLHDDVLPLLHAALLRLNTRDPADPAIANLTQAHRQISDLLHDVLPAGAPELARLGLAGALKRLAREEYASSFDRVEWICDEAAAQTAGRLDSLPTQTAFYAAREAVRNAARHARRPEAGGLCLSVTLALQDGLRIIIEDNGGGFSPDPDAGGAGQGLALHSALLAVTGGSLALESHPGRFTRVILSLPLKEEEE